MRSETKNKQPQDNPMMNRGVVRPMSHQGMGTSDPEHTIAGEHDKHDHMKMDQGQRLDMLTMHHSQTLWAYWMIVILGVWMILSPLTFDYGKNTVAPSGGREVWLSLADRINFMRWSDLISGALLVLFGWRSLQPNRPVSVWICCFIGIWLSAAPIIFWAPTPIAYVNSTLVGSLVIALTILIPGMPNMIMTMKMGSEVPEGWSYNPSSWAQRWIMIVTGFMGWMVSRYLASFQLGYIDSVWDPFFGDSTVKVLNSAMSKSLPVSDAGLGSLAYTFEFLMGFMGSPSRWRTMPWMVAFFGILVIPLGFVHIFLVISQPLTVGAWCTFCLLAAAIMLPMIPLEVDEVIAMGQHMAKATKKGEKFWSVFWKGGESATMNKDEKSPAITDLSKHAGTVLKASIWGMSFPWTLSVTALIGIWIMAAPFVFHVTIKTLPADIGHLCGSLIVVVAVVSMAEVLRLGRYVNILLALVLAIAPWFIPDSPLWLNINNCAAGTLVMILAIPKGLKTQTYGDWDKLIR